MSFCFAKMYADYNPDSKLKPMVWSLCAVLPVIPGVLRYKAGKHYWTDVIAGYAAGALVGIVTPYVHSTSLKFNRQ
jgi:membrane-associated phospholipid phosphatase